MKSRFALAVLALCAAGPLAAPAHAETEAEILLRRYNGDYQGFGGYQSLGPTAGGGYYVRPDESSGTYTGVYDSRGNRLGTVKSDAGGTRFYDNRGNRR